MGANASPLQKRRTPLLYLITAGTAVYQIRLHRNDINGGDGGDGTAVSLQLIAVGTRQCRVLYIIPAQPELILVCDRGSS